MNETNEPLETLSEIRSIMERSTRFISLNGMSGIFAGIFALIGAFAAYLILKTNYNMVSDNVIVTEKDFGMIAFLMLDAAIVLFLSLAVAISLSIRKAHKNGHKIWDSSAKRLVGNFLIPLFVGGFFCLILLYHGLIGLVAPATLIFYGLALVNASKYTLNDIRFLGFFEIILGLVSSVYLGYGLFFWALGFGVLHIFYGTIMYFKYER